MVQPKIWQPGGAIYGDLTQQINEYADAPNPHRLQDPALDPDWNSLVNGVIWKDPDTDQRNEILPTADIVPLTIGMSAGQLVDRFRINEENALSMFRVDKEGLTTVSHGSQRTFSGGRNLLFIGANNSKIQSGTYNFLLASGGIMIDGATPIIRGLNFFPQVTQNTPPTGAVINPLFVSSQPLGASGTWSSYIGADVGLGTALASTGTITEAVALRAALGLLSGMTVPMAINLRIPTIPSGTVRKGIELASSLHVTRNDLKTAAYTMVSNDTIERADATTAGFTITLPTALNLGHVVIIKKVDSGANIVTVAAASGDTIEGAASVALNNQYDALVLYADGGTTWQKIKSL